MSIRSEAHSIMDRIRRAIIGSVDGRLRAADGLLRAKGSPPPPPDRRGGRRAPTLRSGAVPPSARGVLYDYDPVTRRWSVNLRARQMRQGATYHLPLPPRSLRYRGKGPRRPGLAGASQTLGLAGEVRKVLQGGRR